MYNFATWLTRTYHQSIGWNEDNLYSNLTRSSSAILDFAIPPSLILQLSKSPTPIFFTSYSLEALPQLNGSISYITSSIPLAGITPSHAATLKSMTPHFQTYPSPRRPLPPEEEYLAGDLLVPPRDYLLYSRLHLPTLHLSALASTKLSTNLQGSLAFMHSPGALFRSDGGSSGGSGSAGSGVGSSSSSTQQQSGPTFPPSPPANLLLSLQQDHGRWATEYTYSAKDGMVGLRGLWNFGLTEEMLRPTALDDYPIVHTAGPALLSSLSPGEFEGKTDDGKRGPLVDQEDSSENGLRGRFSAGGEIYFSVKQRSLGLSTGLRFTTIPNSTANPTAPVSPPTTLTILYNPLMGFLSTSYAAQVTPRLALASRFGVNVYSYESDLSLGGEWWIGKGRGSWIGSNGKDREVVPGGAGSEPPLTVTTADQDRDGVLRAKVSGTGTISLLYESRIRHCLVSVGVISDLSSRPSTSSPVQAMGLEVQYFADS